MQTLNEKLDLLRIAIRDLKQVTGTYDQYRRVFCPHILGKMSRQWACRVWQFDGQSSKPAQLPDWRNFFIDGLTDVALQDGEWHRGWMTGKRPHWGFDDIDTVVDEAHAAEIRHTSPMRTPGLGTLRLGRRK
jgi:hypothetical protein